MCAHILKAHIKHNNYCEHFCFWRLVWFHIGICFFEKCRFIKLRFFRCNFFWNFDLVQISDFPIWDFGAWNWGFFNKYVLNKSFFVVISFRRQVAAVAAPTYRANGRFFCTGTTLSTPFCLDLKMRSACVHTCLFQKNQKQIISSWFGFEI